MKAEIEIKLDLGSFTDYLKLVGFLGQIDSEEHHINGFFDTEDKQLAAAGWALRVRAEGKRGLVTVKSEGEHSNLAVVRNELESEISRGDALEILNLQSDILKLPVEPIKHVNDLLKNQPVACLVRFENCRQKKKFRLGDYEYVLEIDKTMFPDGSVDYELEVELPGLERQQAVEDHLRRMFTSLQMPFLRQDESKLARAIHRAG